MTLRLRGMVLAASLIAGPLAAEAPDISLVPQIRPGSPEIEAPALRPDLPDADSSAVEVSMRETPPATIVAAGLVHSPLPIPRPRVVIRNAPPPDANVPDAEPVRLASAGPVVSPAPPPKRPKGGFLAALFRAPDKPSKYPSEGSVCGDPAIRGQALPPIAARLRGCGQTDPVRITAVDGVALTTPATISCGTAVALRRWVSGVVKPVVGRHGGGVAALTVAASYSCRTRNNVPGAKISEHGRGKAIDISAIVLKNGSAMTVLHGWRDKVQGPLLQKIHAAACGTFGTVLGPRSDRYHQDHFHLDTATHGYGPYCR